MGIKEAIAFKTPVINIGSRQNGRLKPLNVINKLIQKIFLKRQNLHYLIVNLKINVSNLKTHIL